MATILMDYPFYDGSNKLYDGESHTIQPIKLYSFMVNGRKFFTLHYYDITMKKSCFTILATINGNVVKLPLDDYSKLDAIFNNIDLKKANFSELPEHIALGMTLGPNSFRSLIENDNAQEPIIDLKYHYAYLREKPTDIASKIYQSRGLVSSYFSSTQHYIFEKQTLCDTAASTLISKIEKEPIATKLGLNFELNFKIKVKDGDTMCLVEKNGNESRIRLAYLVPGIHQYKFYLSPCDLSISQESISCVKCIINAPKEYNDLHDCDKVFTDGFAGKLPIDFDNGISKNKSLFIKRSR